MKCFIKGAMREGMRLQIVREVFIIEPYLIHIFLLMIVKMVFSTGPQLEKISIFQHNSLIFRAILRPIFSS